MASRPSNSQQQGLPSIQSLTNGLPRPSGHQLSPADRPQSDQLRDSDNSANSGLQVHTLLNPDDSPPRNSIPNTPQSARVPTSAHSIGSQLPSINQGFHDSGHRASIEYPGTLDSRRSSVDSRMHQGFGNLYINNPVSPYESQNASQVSLAASLRRPGNGAPMSPLSGRSSLRGPPIPQRQAPQILPTRGPGVPDPTAAKPTLGHAWAFPDDTAIPEERRTSDSGESSVGVSRTNSFAASSIRSSIFSTDSHMPHGQRRFDDDQTTHHHSMQHRAVQSLQTEGTPPAGIGNYSRTPELRVSHKLAERKRRSEMKDLFEDLNKAVPANGGTKASKWEILTKAIEHIRSCQHTERALQVELNRLQREADYAREAHTHNEALKTEIQVMQQHLRRLDSNATHIYGPYTQQLNQQGPSQANGGVALPPLHAAAPSAPVQPSYGNGVQNHPPGAMQGVEYGGYRG